MITKTSRRQAEAAGPSYVEVWGDTVDSRHLAIAVLIGVVISLGAYLLAAALFAGVVERPAMARAYAMLVGLGGCLVAGAICARLFRPKREVVDESADHDRREAAIAQLASAGGLGRVADLPAEVAAEMKELGLYYLFAEAERDARRSGEADHHQQGGAAPAGELPR